jgi:hypothetical protein
VSATAGDAERVARRIGKNHPAELVPERVPPGLGRAGSHESRDLGVDVRGSPRVDVLPVMNSGDSPGGLRR